LRERSGSVDTNSDLVSFFYELMRDHLSAGTVETIAINSNSYGEGKWALTNGWLANYAKDLVKRLLMTDEDRETLGFLEAMLLVNQPDGLNDDGKKLRQDAVKLIRRLRNP
jgi:hypothetical protein